jgi:two-component system response regulator FixJ
LSLIVDIVEDDDAVRDSMCALLDAYGYAPRGYASPVVYLKSAAGAPGNCLIVDLHMPEMTGLELLETLRSQDVRIPALMMTGRHDPSLEPRIAQAGVVKLLHKPIQDEQLFSWIEQACVNAAATPPR